MGAYSINLFESLNDYDNIEPEDIDELIDNDDIEEVYEESVIATAMRVVSETSSNWNSIMKACAIDELHYLEENGTEMIYEGSRIKSFFNAAIEFFKNIWTKIQGIFKRFIMSFDASIKSDKEFLNKYKKELNVASHKDFGDKEVSVYNYIFYTGSNKGLLASDILKTADLQDSDAYLKNMTLDEIKTKNKESTEEAQKETVDKYRGSILKADKVEAGDFNKLLKEHYQGSDSKDDQPLGTFFSTCKSFLADSAGMKTAIEKDLNAYKTSINTIIKKLTNLEKSLKKETEADDTESAAISGAKLSLITKDISVTKTIKNVQISATGVQLGCLKAASKQAKSICVTALAYNPKKSANESGLFIQQESDMSLLDNVILR